jgi:serine/threonine protein kinase/WD40 repeat protein
MASDRFARIESVYHAARARAPEERAAYLADACGTDEDLRREVESLLAQPGGLLTSVALNARPALASGTIIGTYRIVEQIGAGGMGEVYRARDMTLGRDVAIKVLPEAWLSDPDRRVRFDREAKVLAALNHPGIGAIYGIAEGHGTRGLVLELVEGATLAERLRSGPLPLDTLLPIARQIADAVAAAHEKGIVHRDLKPANIKLPPDGFVKVLDFGLAKEMLPPPDAGSLEPTITGLQTSSGLVLGTAAYMSPEQARGQNVDARTDVWAFGCILYEMLTGRRAFGGPTASDTIAGVLERDPDWDALPASTPVGIRRLLVRCLDKDPKRRLHAVADVQFDLEETLVERRPGIGPPSPAGSPDRRAVLWPAVALGVVVVSAAVWVWSTQPATLPPPRVMSLTSYRGSEISPSFSPDGAQVAFMWDGAQHDNQDVYVVMVGSDQQHRLTTDPAPDISPAWKPDGSEIAFVRVVDGRAGIYVVSPLGESEHRLDELPLVPGRLDLAPIPTPVHQMLSWSPDGRWLAVSRVMSGEDRGIFLVASDGSARHLLLRAAKGETFDSATFSPDGQRLAYLSGGVIYIAQLRGDNPPAIVGTPAARTDRLRGLGQLGLTWTADGQALIFGQATGFGLWHLWRVAVTRNGAPERIDLAGFAGFPAISKAGNRLAFSRSSSDSDIYKVMQDGRLETIQASSFNEGEAAVSPDGEKVAFLSERNGEDGEIWIAGMADGSKRRSLTNGLHKPEGSPQWSQDGLRIAFDGFDGTSDPSQRVFVVEAAGGAVRSIPSKAGFSDNVPSWSHDGKYIYFGSNRSGRNEVWRAPADGGEPVQITTTGGWAPVESWDGKTLYFSRVVGPSRRSLMAMPVAGGSERQLGITTTHWNYVDTARGLYYVAEPIGQHPPYTYEIRVFDSSTGRSQIMISVPLSFMSSGLGVFPDGKSVLVSGVQTINHDLFRIESFR